MRLLATHHRVAAAQRDRQRAGAELTTPCIQHACSKKFYIFYCLNFGQTDFCVEERRVEMKLSDLLSAVKMSWLILSSFFLDYLNFEVKDDLNFKE